MRFKMQEEISNQSSQLYTNICSICGQQDQQILILSCAHHSCINCASTHYFHHYHQDFKQNHIYWCEVCCEPTSIDQETVLQISMHIKHKLKLTKKSKQPQLQNFTLTRAKSLKHKHVSKHNHPNYDYTPISIKSNNHQRLKNNGRGSSSQQQDFLSLSRSFSPSEAPTQQKLQEVRSMSKLNTLRSNIKYCHQHKDEVQNYYCFTCLSAICVECALHGNHIGHEVEAIRKAGSKLRGVYELVLSDCQKYLTILQSHSKQINFAIEAYQKWHEKQEDLIKLNFSKLFQLLHEQQRTLLDNLHQNTNEGIRKLKNERNFFDKNQYELKVVQNEFKINLNKDMKLWETHILENQKQRINKVISTKILKQSTGLSKSNIKLQYMDVGLIIEGVNMMEQLVQSFKITTQNMSPFNNKVQS